MNNNAMGSRKKELDAKWLVRICSWWKEYRPKLCFLMSFYNSILKILPFSEKTPLATFTTCCFRPFLWGNLGISSSLSLHWPCALLWLYPMLQPCGLWAVRQLTWGISFPKGEIWRDWKENYVSRIKDMGIKIDQHRQDCLEEGSRVDLWRDG